MQLILEGPLIAQGRLEAPTPQARLYANTNIDAITSTSNVVASQLPLASFNVYTLFDSGTTHSFIPIMLALRISNSKDRILIILRTTLPSGKVLL